MHRPCPMQQHLLLPFHRCSHQMIECFCRAFLWFATNDLMVSIAAFLAFSITIFCEMSQLQTLKATFSLSQKCFAFLQIRDFFAVYGEMIFAAKITFSLLLFVGNEQFRGWNILFSWKLCGLLLSIHLPLLGSKHASPISLASISQRIISKISLIGQISSDDLDRNFVWHALHYDRN